MKIELDNLLKKLLQAHARQEVIEFNYWANNNVYTQIGLETWKDRSGTEWSTSELYDMFIAENV